MATLPGVAVRSPRAASGPLARRQIGSGSTDAKRAHAAAGTHSWRPGFLLQRLASIGDRAGPASAWPCSVFVAEKGWIAALADAPRLGGVVARGTAGTYRLHAGSARILYEVDGGVATVQVISIGIIS